MPAYLRQPPARFAADLADRYAFEHLLGRGAAAAVYLARDRKHGRPVAVKVLDPAAARAAGRTGAARFRREIGLVARLQHPHILPLYDSGEAGGRPYFVMPYVAGPSLRARLRAGAPLPAADALRLAAEVADALGYAHACGVVHRDVKPENVLLTGDGPTPGTAPFGDGFDGDGPDAPPRHALVCDFGIARLTRPDGPVGDGDTPPRTSTGQVIGTLSYMAPEQASAAPVVGPAADVFALGVVLYELLTGAVPYADATAPHEALRRRLTGPPARLGGRAPGLGRHAAQLVDAVLARAMAVDPARRYASAAEMVAPLREARAAAAVPVPAGGSGAAWWQAPLAAVTVVAERLRPRR